MASTLELRRNGHVNFIEWLAVAARTTGPDGASGVGAASGASVGSASGTDLVLAQLDDVASRIVNANHGVATESVSLSVRIKK